MIAFLCLAGVLLARLHLEPLTGASVTLFANHGGVYANWFLSCKESLCLVLAFAVCIYAAGERMFPDQVCRVKPLYRRSAVSVRRYAPQIGVRVSERFSTSYFNSLLRN